MGTFPLFPLLPIKAYQVYPRHIEHAVEGMIGWFVMRCMVMVVHRTCERHYLIDVLWTVVVSFFGPSFRVTHPFRQVKLFDIEGFGNAQSVVFYGRQSIN